MDRLPYDIDGYELTRSDEYDRGYLLNSIGKSIIASVDETERELSELWIYDTLKMVTINLDSGNNETFILRDCSGNRVGILWMGRSFDQFTCTEIGYVLSIFVEKELRGNGLGKALMRSAERWCAANDLYSLSLNVGTENRTALALYKSIGFEPQSTVMRKKLR